MRESSGTDQSESLSGLGYPAQEGWGWIFAEFSPMRMISLVINGILYVRPPYLSLRNFR